MGIERIDSGMNVSGVRPPTPQATPRPEAQTGEAALPHDQVDLTKGKASSRKADVKAPQEKEREPEKPPKPGEKEWTVLVYVNGQDGALSRLAPAKLRQLENAGSDDNLTILAQVSRKKSWIDRISKDWSGTRRYVVQRNPEPPGMQEELINWFIPPYTKNIISPVTQDLGPNVDSGDPKVLGDFLKWGIKNYPAKHYAVVIYGQGGGFTGSVLDAKTGHVIDNRELKDALKEASAEAGKKIDVLAFDGSLMGNLETAHELKDSAKVMVGSEAVTGLGSLALDMVMKDLKFSLQDGPVTPEDLAKWFVFETRYTPRPSAELMNPTLSAYDLEKLDRVRSAFGDLAKELAHALNENPALKDALREDIQNTQSFVKKGGGEPYQDYRDLTHFSENIIADERFACPNLKAKAKGVTEAIKEATIDEVHIGKAMKDAHGMSAYMPLDYGYDLPPSFFTPKDWSAVHEYDKSSIGIQTVWDDVLSAIAKDTKFHSALRSMGLPDHVINKIDKTLDAGKRAALFALGVARNAGHYEVYQAMRGKPPKDFLGIPAEVAVKIGIAGGAYEAFNGAKQIFDAATDKDLANPKQKIVDGAFDTATGAAVMASCIGVSFAQAAGMAQPAAIAAFAIPFAKMVYDIYQQTHQSAKMKDELSAMTPEARAEKVSQDADKDFYISPIVRFAAKHGSQGPIDTSKIKE